MTIKNMQDRCGQMPWLEMTLFKYRKNCGNRLQLSSKILWKWCGVRIASITMRRVRIAIIRAYGLNIATMLVYGWSRTIFVPTEKGKTMECCNGCVPPKRHKACWGHCPEYIAERAEYDRRKSIEDQKNAISVGIYRQKVDGISRAVKRHGGKRT